MTASLLLLIVSFAALHLSISSQPSRLVRLVAIATGGLALLPLAFGPFVPIAHIIFESTGRRMLWIAQAFCALLSAALVWRIVVQWRKRGGADIDRLLAGVMVGHAIWLASSIRISDFEQGVTTPGVWDAPIYVLDWLAAVSMCALLALAAWRSANSQKLYRLLSIAYFSIVAILAIGTVS